MTDTSADVAIIGGGIVGLSCALHLQRRGRSVVVIDPGRAEARASYGNAGVISRGSLFPVAGPGIWRNLLRYALGRDVGVRIRVPSLPTILPWGVSFLRSSNERSWRAAATALNPIAAAAYGAHLDLADRVGARELIKRNGWLRLYRSEAAWAASAIERAVLTECGVVNEALTAGEIGELEPSLAPRFTKGLFFPETGSVESPGDLVRAYEAYFRDAGGAILTGEASGIGQQEAGVTIQVGQRAIKASWAVLAAGAASGKLARSLGYRLPLAAERGYHTHVALAGNAVLNRPVNDTAGGYVISPMGEHVRVLTGVELARPSDPPNEEQLRIVLGDARRTIPLDSTPKGQAWHGSRPSTPDGLPVIGWAPRHDRVVFAFGHGHIGLATGPISGRIVADLVDGIRSDLPIGPFSPGRFV
ncbi:MAG TPA: FAD-binding oxidoreductase [Salinarimonas sp.]|nr:FAD-binding oxidoreductase [Salinarimonas sp.]